MTSTAFHSECPARPSPRDIERAADILRTGGLVAFPTETVYGLGADAANPRAVATIFTAKGRPADHPLIVHIGRQSELDDWAGDVPPLARRLAARFWPGPLTLILKCRPHVSGRVTGGQDTVGLRMPAHPVALALLQTFGGGIAAPSANRFGRISPTTAAHVRDELGDAVEIIDGGPCPVGLESTIVDLSEGRPRILRAGTITPADLAGVFGGTVPAAEEKTAVRAPGRLASHYAPDTPMRLLDAPQLESAVRAPGGRPVTVLSLSPPPPGLTDCRWWIMPGDPKDYARVLYARLREADRSDCRHILLERPPAAPEWDAINDRLRRACHRFNTSQVT